MTEYVHPRYTALSQKIHIESHGHWIATGGCPSVRMKSWCNARRDTPHSRHYAFGFAPTPTAYWTDNEAERCPCPKQ